MALYRKSSSELVLELGEEESEKEMVSLFIQLAELANSYSFQVIMVI